MLICTVAMEICYFMHPKQQISYHVYYEVKRMIMAKKRSNILIFKKKMYQHNLSYMYCTVLNMHCGGKCHDDFTTLYFLAVYCSSALIYIHFHLIHCMWTTIQTRMRFIYNNYSLASNSHQRLAKITLWKWRPIDRKRTNFVKDHSRSKEHSSCVHCQMI